MTSTLTSATPGIRSLPKIAAVTLHPVTTSRLYGQPSQHVLICLQATDGTEGWGEMSDVSHLPAMMPDVADLQLCLTALLQGWSAGDINGIEDAMLQNFPGTRFHGKACLVRAGVSIAIHDLKARLLGLSVTDLLGGARRYTMPICYPIFRLSGPEDLPDRRELVRRQFDKGFTHFRFYFGPHTDADCELLDWIGSTYGERLTMTSLDGSGLLTLPSFLRAYRRLSAYRFESVESPVDRDDCDLIAEARRSIDHPVSEHVRSPEYAMRLIRLRAVDIFNISITVAGGISGMLKLFAIADAANIECLIGTTQELSIATAAQGHVGLAAPRLDYASDPVGPSLYEQDVVTDSVQFADGCLVVPEGPGLGITVDRARLRAIEGRLSSLNDVQTSFTRG